MPSSCSGLWRSEDMTLVQLHFQREAAHDVVLRLGRLGCVQFLDMNPSVSAFQRHFTHDLRRCEEMERRLRFLEEQLRKETARHAYLHTVVESDTAVDTLDTLEPRLEALESELLDLSAKWTQLLSQRNSLREHLEILSQPSAFFRGEGVEAEAPAWVSGGPAEDLGRTGRLQYLAGILRTDRVALFERLLYRSTRGNMLLRTSPCRDLYEDPETGDLVEKTVFVVFLSAQRARDKVIRLCESVQAPLYPYTIDSPAEAQNAAKIQAHLEDIEMTMTNTEEHRVRTMMKIAQELTQWKRTVITEKSVFGILNLLSFKGQTVVAEGWAPTDQLDSIRSMLSEAERTSGARQQSSFMERISGVEPCPTHFRTNKFTSIHQSIVESYGIARYKEINPTSFSIITFPFLFGVMYGDIGHGILLTLLAVVFIAKEKELTKINLNEIIELVFGGRYVLLLMGLFAIYLGFLYNDFFGMMIAPFGRPFWYFPENGADAVKNCDPGYVVFYGAKAGLTRGCKVQGGSPYIFGVDADWAETENKLEFMNGLKMKMAVILGVGQMMWGLVLQLLNHLFYKEHRHIWFGLIPEVVFLGCTFGYMCVMIVIKCLVDWTARMNEKADPPSLLETMTNFFLFPFTDPDKYLYVSAPFQNGVQSLLLILAVLSVPMMLVPIPYLEWKRRKARRMEGYGRIHEVLESIELHHGSSGTQAGPPSSGEDHSSGHASEDMSEVVIKQVIHTIEYVLGCVSNTASYLRLWALSLAHAELSEVFWNFAWMKPLTWDGGSGLLAFVGWGIWFAVTIGVLGVMESLSAFLHALRLHWVEFQNKFYYGDGVPFVPYDIHHLLSQGLSKGRTF
eukprot:RCo017309